MKTPKTKSYKFVWALPTLALLLFAFAEPSYRAKDVEPRGKEAANDILVAEKTIKMVGYVFDENNEALPGTSVVIKNATVGTVCDIDGKFELEVPEKASILLSFVGKKTLVDNYNGITSGVEKDGVFYKKYKMQDAVILIGNDVPPPPPPKVKKEDVPPPPPPPSPLKKGDKEQEVFYIVEDMPQFPGGQKALQEYITKMQQKLSQEKDIKGKVMVEFTVNGKGKVSDIKILALDDPKIKYSEDEKGNIKDAEFNGKRNPKVENAAVEIVKKMPDWTPGKQRGKPVSVKYLLPIEFK